MRLDLKTPVSLISQVGKVTATKLKKLGVETVTDLIFYYPFRYEDFSQISTIDQIKAGASTTIKGKLEMIENRRSWKKKKFLTEALISDKTGSVKAIWFNQPYLAKIMHPGDEIYFSGRVDTDKYSLQFINPIYEKVKQSGQTLHTARIVPIYSTTEGLTQKQIRWLIKVALGSAGLLADWLPEEIIKEQKFLNLAQALTQIHFPDSQEKVNQAVRRLKFDEIFLFLLQAKLVRKELNSCAAPPVAFQEKVVREFVSKLPFILTADQKKAAWQILNDLNQSQPMNRLLEGDVGSGKTLVAAISILNAALGGYQSVLMAPTEILATQHYKTLLRLFEDSNIKIALLTSALQKTQTDKATKKHIIDQIKSGEIKVIIGTHTLIQQGLNFNKLALVVIDEQHRFGVEQRKILHDKGTIKNIVPHFLSMTATPIPRSLALTLYGDLDLSIIRELPQGRKKIITEIIEPADRSHCYEFIRQEIKSGRQVFVICPLIDPSDDLGVKSVNEEYQRLKESVFTDLTIDKLHGRMKTPEKQKIMANFLAKESDILVTTSVVEVGVDVPNATVMVIEGAQRFGLSQLHQFRGRVGRGQHQSYCFLFMESSSTKTKARLQALVEAKDGFELAELDLSLRGPGEIFGLNQSGWPGSRLGGVQFRIASLFDLSLISLAKDWVDKIMKKSHSLDVYPTLKKKVEQLNQTVHLE